MSALPAIIEAQGESLPAIVREEVEAAHAFQMNEKASATRRAYQSDFRIFADWCSARGVEPIPAAPEVVSTFLASQATAGVKASTLARRTAAIRYAHALKGVEPPTNSEGVKATMRGIRRTLGTKPEQKAAATSERVALMASLTPATLGGFRDKALLLLGFSGAFRRSELVALEVSDLSETEEGYRVTIRRSKTDQEGAGHEVAILRGSRLRAVEAVRAWLEAAGIVEGPLFRPVAKGGRVLAEALTAESVANVVKAYAMRAGFDPGEFAGHSLRAGFLTSAAEHGASIFKMMEVSRHKSVDVLKGYVRRAELFKEHAGAGFL
jgi:site-specific recombinase XerD